MQVLTKIQNNNKLPCIVSIFYPLILLFSKIIWMYNDLTFDTILSCSRVPLDRFQLQMKVLFCFLALSK